MRVPKGGRLQMCSAADTKSPADLREIRRGHNMVILKMEKTENNEKGMSYIRRAGARCVL